MSFRGNTGRPFGETTGKHMGHLEYSFQSSGFIVCPSISTLERLMKVLEAYSIDLVMNRAHVSY